MIRVLFLGVISFINIGIVLSQDKCECCSYNSIDNIERFERFFSPSIIGAKNIKHAVVYTTEKYDNKETRYIQTKFDFNKQGYVIARKWYNRGGKPHSIYNYERNERNLISKITFSYLDSNEVVSDFMPPQITDYHYDQTNRLIQLKQRDYLGNIVADSLSHYTNFKYNDYGKVIQETRHFYWDGLENDSKHSYNDTRIRYVDDEALSETYIDNQLWLKSTTKNDVFGNEIFREDFNVKLNSLAFKIYSEYDEDNRLVLYKVDSGDGAGTECEDGGNFQENYLYNENGLLIEIVHRFENVECKMELDYE